MSDLTLTPFEFRVLECVRHLDGWNTSTEIHFVMNGKPQNRLDTIAALKHLADAGYIQRRMQEALMVYHRKEN